MEGRKLEGSLTAAVEGVGMRPEMSFTMRLSMRFL
jgi:hypothetical protein